MLSIRFFQFFPNGITRAAIMDVGRKKSGIGFLNVGHSKFQSCLLPDIFRMP